MKVAVIYYSRGGTTKKMAELIAATLKEENIPVDTFLTEEIEPTRLLEYDGILIGSPTYYGAPAAEIKKLLDDTVSFHGKLDGKCGGAFSSAANVAGGNETTIISILEGMLIHGMIIQGDPKGDHYGPVVIGRMDARAQDNCERFARRFAALLKKVISTKKA
jgi:NAD(P)H dehydrogenase (quinone)